MIAFVTLFLGLTFGTHTITVAVSDAVASVELMVDGVSVATLEGEPWATTWDFGPLAPHVVEAIAYDEAGDELGRTRQRVNLPRPPIAASLTIDPAGEERRTIARLHWESLEGLEPSSVRLTFDGVAVDVVDPKSIQLPDLDPEQLHFVRAEIDFGAGGVASAEAAFGGQYLDSVSTGLTVVPVRLDGRRKLPPVEKLDGWFTTSRESAPVVAVESDRAEIVVVRSLSSVGDLRQVRQANLRKALPSATWRRARPFASEDWELRMVWPVAEEESDGTAGYRLFPFSRPPASALGNLVRWITETDPPDELRGAERLAEAVAVAGVTASGSNRRRAVLLIVGEPEADASELAPVAVRGFLEKLRVPLVVWRTRPTEAASVRWGSAEDVSTQEGLDRAAVQLLERLDRQRTVWLAGEHLPENIELGPQAAGVRLLD